MALASLVLTVSIVLAPWATMVLCVSVTIASLNRVKIQRCVQHCPLVSFVRVRPGGMGRRAALAIASRTTARMDQRA